MEKNKKSFLNTGDKSYCCGCRACEQICPKHCIKMCEKEGFIYPLIDKKSCIQCGLCEKVCQYNKGGEHFSNVEEQEVYAGWNKDEQVVKNSTSGGVFTALSDVILEQGGVIFGAGFDSGMNVKIQKAENKNERDIFRGSKYIWSDTQDTYTQVKEILLSGKMVLFAGTPCQISGLRSFLGKRYEGLFCIDLICHGMPSVLVWNEYKKYIEKKYGGRIEVFKFRHRTEGVMESAYYAEFKNGKKMQESLSDNAYSKTYNSLIAHMPACYACQYTRNERVGDVTIGDFWGIEIISPEDTNQNGTSFISVNTKQGKKLFLLAEKKLRVSRRKMSEAVKKNPALHESVKQRPWRKSFFRSIQKYGFFTTYQIYINIGNKVLIPYRVIRKIRGKVEGRRRKNEKVS